MIKLPARQDGNWTVQYANDKIPDIVGTKNVNFDKEGYIKLSKPTASFYSTTDDADFLLPVGIIQGQEPGQFYIATKDRIFTLDMYNSGNYGTLTATEETAGAGTSPVCGGTYSNDAAYFDNEWNILNPDDRKLYYATGTYSGTFGSLAWSTVDISASLEAATSLFCCSFLSQSNLAITNDNNVDQYTSGGAITTPALVIPNEFSITGITYNNGFVGITTRSKTDSSRSAFFVWDGNTAEANYVLEVPSYACYSPVPYRGSFVFLSGGGLLYYWSGSSLEVLASLPIYFTSATYSVGLNTATHNHGVYTDGELIHINLKSLSITGDDNDFYYQNNQPGGVWTYDPSVGLYHRNSPSGTKITVDTIATTSVDVDNDKITVTAAPETGTPVRYFDAGSTAITGLVSDTVYYAIKVDATNIKLATSYSNAIANTAIDLTGTGNNSQTLHFIFKTDFGNSYVTGEQGAVYFEQVRPIDSELYFDGLFYGSNCAKDTTTEYSVGGFALKDTENRGYFITSKFVSSSLEEDWQKIFVKHKTLSSSLDKIVVKYRTDNNKLLTGITSSSDGIITWTDNNTFTTTDTQWANVQAGDEVEFIQGTGSGYLAHVTSISESSGTYTVNIDETIKNLTAAKTGRAIASRWKKLTTLDNGIISNEDGYSEITVGVKSKQIQFKIELRGEDIEIEEILIANQLHKPVA